MTMTVNKNQDVMISKYFIQIHTLVKYNRYSLRLEFHTIVKTKEYDDRQDSFYDYNGSFIIV